MTERQWGHLESTQIGLVEEGMSVCAHGIWYEITKVEHFSTGGLDGGPWMKLSILWPDGATDARRFYERELSTEVLARRPKGA